ncbi:MAG: hypothetical protein JNM46_09210 [Anaerolineales bacterium]|nr:hypothetical protein [Anaerolineales bacterium]
MTQTFQCTACGAPNQPEAGLMYMLCTYCGTNLTIPESLRIKSMPRVEKSFTKAETTRPIEVEAADILRKSQPIAIRAWNLFAAWTWLRWLIPTCLTIFIVLCVGFVIVLFVFS